MAVQAVRSSLLNRGFSMPVNSLRFVRLVVEGIVAASVVLLLTVNAVEAQETQMPQLGDDLTLDQVTAFAALALQGIDQEYPNKPSNVLVDSSSLKSPQEMHPAFFGCFDWHSSVHGHWMLVRLIRLHPTHPQVDEIRARLASHLTKEFLATEAKYFLQKQSKSFERMYGWAWTLRLVTELSQWDDAQGNEWREHLRPLEVILVAAMHDYLPKLSFPVRTGVHPDTAFALSQALDYSREVGNQQLENLIVDRSRDYYLDDRNYPSLYEPSGEDFFSAGLNEADLMRRVLDRSEYSDWLGDFLPGLGTADEHRLLQPVEVSDVTDGKIVHLAGLDLSRAWCLQGIANALDDNDRRKKILIESAKAHAEVGFRYVFSGHYAGEHWLATFAVYTLTQVGME